MRNLILGLLFAGLIFSACNQSNSLKNDTTTENAADTIKDKQEITILIRQVLSWAESNNSIDLLPAATDSKDSVYIGFDLNKLQLKLDTLKQTNLFASEFIENYDSIIHSLDKKLRNKELEPWLVGDLPTFKFANEVDPWCLCEDVPYDKPNPWDSVQVEIIKLNPDSGELNWKWGKPELIEDPGWKQFNYKFKVVKENGKWKISYMQGFDYNEGIKRDGV